MSHFSKLTSVSKYLDVTDFEEYAKILSDLRSEFDVRFQDLENLESTFQLLATYFSVDIESVSKEFQVELMDLQYDREMKDAYQNKRRLEDFYLMFSQSRFPRLHRQAAHILSIFGSTYMYEQLFSLMKHCKPSYRSQVSDNNLKCSFDCAQ